MLKTLANFVVKNRIAVLAVMLVLTLAAAVCALFVEVNADMTKYLPDDSNMKIGMDIMEEAFPELESSNTIRVMFDDLTEADKAVILEKISSIEHVDSVDHDPVSADYNKGNHTLFVINMSCDYDSPEEKAIEAELASRFADYKLIWQNDDTSSPDIPAVVIVVIIIILFAILFTMCGSWLEPFLFLLTIGMAIVLNAGTNLLLGTISDVTSSITALLQMVLSMDYSVIMMNRYRQERKLEPDKIHAMKSAWAKAFASVSSSSLTTVVGLLMLVFMSFKIGTDLGVVLAKGVFISMICVLTILPGLIIICDELLIKTAKKELHVPTDWIAKFSHKGRYALTALFFVLFAAFYIWQTKTQIDYTLVKDDAVVDVFPMTNPVVMVYESRDENNLEPLISTLEENDKVSSVTAYSTILGRPHNSTKLVDAIGELSDEFTLDPEMIDMLYYHYFNGGESGTMTAGKFLSFISDTVVNDDKFSDYIDDELMDKVDMIGKFADAEELQKPLMANELADLFDMNSSNIKDLLLLYQIESGAAAPGSMTLATFTNFVINDVANDPVYGAMFDSETLSQLNQLATFTDARKMTRFYPYQVIANLLGVEADQAKLLFIYYQALSSCYDPGTMTLPEFLYFLQNDLATDPLFSDYMDQDSLQQLSTLSLFIDKNELHAQRDAATLASLLGIDESMANTIFALHSNQDVSGKTMSLAQFTAFLTGNLLNEPMFAASFDEETKLQLQSMNSLVQVAASKQGLSYAQMAQILGMDESQTMQLYYLYFSTNTDLLAATTMSLPDFLALLKANSAPEQQVQLAQMEQLISLSISGEELSAAELAAITGMPEEQVVMMFAPDVERMSLAAFLSTALTMSPDNAQLQQLWQIVQLASSGAQLDAQSLAGIFGIDQSQVMQLFTLTMAQQGTIALDAFTAFLVNDVLQNEAYASGFSPEQQEQLYTMNQLVQTAASGAALDGASLAAIFGMDESLVTIILRLHTSEDLSSKTMSLAETVDFIIADPVLNSYMDSADIEQLANLKQLAQAAESNEQFTSKTMAQTLGMDESSVKMLYTIRASVTQLKHWYLSMHTLVNFLVDNQQALGSAMGSDQIESLTMAQKIINGSVKGSSYTANEISSLIGMTRDQARQLYLLHARKYGDISGWRLSIKSFIDFINSTVISNAEYSSKIDAESRKMLSSAKRMVDAVIEDTPRTPEQISEIFRGLTDDLDTADIEMMYLYANSLENSDPSWTMTLETLFNHLVDKVLADPRFDAFIDDQMRADLLENKSVLEDGKLQLVGNKYSRLVISTTYLEESAETSAFIKDIKDYTNSNMDGSSYLIGGSPMNYEMQQIFDKELTFITLLTAFAIFLIVALTFRSLSIPLILVLLVQCGVYITVTVTGIISGGMYFLALLIVECILMGATIDYGILFTNYYCEHRRNLAIKEAMKMAYADSIHTIMTSGMVLVLITAVVGRMFEDAAVSAIVKTISIGSFCAITLILFVLPGILAACDKLVIKKKKT